MKKRRFEVPESIHSLNVSYRIGPLRQPLCSKETIEMSENASLREATAALIRKDISRVSHLLPARKKPRDIDGRLFLFCVTNMAVGGIRLI